MNIIIFRLYGGKFGGTELATDSLKNKFPNEVNTVAAFRHNERDDPCHCLFDDGYVIDNKIIFFLKYFKKIFCYIRKEKPKCVIGTDMLTSSLLCIISIFLNIRVIAWEHYPRDKNSIVWRALSFFLYRLACHVVVLTPLECLKYKFVKTKVLVIPNFLRFPVVGSGKKHRHINGSCIRLLSVGRLSNEKGYHRLLECVNFCNKNGLSVSLDVAGAGAMHDELCLFIKDNGIDARLLGNVEHIDKLMMSYDIFVSGSFYECLPLSLIEAMACGLPVISYDNPAAKFLLESSRAGVIVSSELAFMNAIVSVVNNYDAISRDGKEFVKSHFSDDAILATWSEIIFEH